MICNKESCTGCYACANICPKDAIEFKEDEYGYIYPYKKDNCINCGLCKQVCPSINNKIIYRKPKIAYAAWSLDKDNRKTSTSGGVASIISKYILDNNGVVYGASYNEELSLEHIRVDNKKQLKKLKGSKYVHSKVGITYRQVKKDLKEDKVVLYLGTPCQIAGLLQYLKKDYEKLIVIDIVCHGVPSQKLLKEYIYEEVGDTKIDEVLFREGNNYVISFKKKEQVIYRKVIRESTYFTAFMKSIISRDNCYECKYARPERISDLTIGDFWGIGREEEFPYQIKDGVSLILVNTNKGEKLVNGCSNELFVMERKLSEAINGNSQLREPSKASKEIDLFRKIYLKKGFNKAVKKCFRNDFIKYKIKKKIRKLDF